MTTATVGPNAVSTVYVHGTGIHSQASWKSEWDLALFGRPMDQRTVGVNWARQQSGSQEGPLSIQQILDDAGVDTSESEAYRFAETLMTGMNVEFDGSSRARPFSLPDAWRGRCQRNLLRTYITDAVAYFFNSNLRQLAKKRLRSTIKKQKSRFVLVAHGLGSVLAYEVFLEMDQRRDEPPDSKRAKHNKDVRIFVTLGSPLGTQEFQDRLTALGMKEFRVPGNLSAWHNIADHNDLIAMDPALANDFLPASDIEIQDYQVTNRNLWIPEGWTPHDATGYLSHPDVRNIVHQAVGFDPADRFVVARDVAFALSGYNKRQPVLIEALELHYNAIEEDDEARIRRERRQGHKTLSQRIEQLAEDIVRVVRRNADAPVAAVREARVQTLRKYVSAHLTPSEIQELAGKHADFNIYAMWRSSSKKTLIHRSHRVIGADAARVSFDAKGQGITWAVLDTGCRSDHPHFQPRRKKRRRLGNTESLISDVLDCTSHPSDHNPNPGSLHVPPQIIDSVDEQDPHGHGTHVCGIISGRSRAGKRSPRFFGVAPKTKLLVYKVLNEHGAGEDAWIIKALDDIFQRNENNSGLAVHGVNLSLGGPFDASVYGCGFSPICQMLRDLWRQGVLVCVAAGNEGQIRVSTADGPLDLNTALSIGDPANQEDCIAVGSANTDKPHVYGVSHFSSRGPTADGRVKPDVVAPGERIHSANNNWDNKLYRQASGTSMACPHVSGLLAAFLSVRREFIGRPDEVKQILLDNCNDLKRHRNHQGHGMPNLLKMLTNT